MPLAGRDAELLATELFGWGAVGIEERPDALVAVFDTPGAAAAVAAALGTSVRVVAGDGGPAARPPPVAVVRAGPFAVHPPSLPAPDGAISVAIDPGSAFGSGSHPSTRLALELVAATVRPGDQVADIGSGSGVLAVAAARLDARVVAVDVDAAAVATTRSNAAANGVADRVTVRRGSADVVPGPVDVVVVNLTVDRQERVAPTVRTLGARSVLVAGILGHQAARAVAAHGGKIGARLEDGEWVGLRVDS